MQVSGKGRLLCKILFSCQKSTFEILYHTVVFASFFEILLVFAIFQIGSPTALAVDETWKNLQKISLEYKHTVYVPSGAFWGGEDISKMADLGTLKVNIS